MADAVSVKKELNWMKAHLLFPGSFALEFLPAFFFMPKILKSGLPLNKEQVTQM